MNDDTAMPTISDCSPKTIRIVVNIDMKSKTLLALAENVLSYLCKIVSTLYLSLQHCNVHFAQWRS